MHSSLVAPHTQPEWLFEFDRSDSDANLPATYLPDGVPSRRLKEREERMHEKFRRLQLELDARDHQLRGQVAAEEDRLQQARHTADREAEQRDAVLRDKEDRLRRHEEILADRQREIDRLRAALVSETDKARDQARMEMWEELSTQREQLRADRLSLEKDKARLAEQREEFSDQLLRARSLAEKLRASESLRVEADARAAALAAAEEPMRAHMARVEEDNKQLRQALASAVNQQAAQQIQLRGAVQPEVDRARQDAVEARQEVQALRHKLGRYRDALDEAEEAVALLETNDAARLQQIHRLERLLEDAVRARDETLARFEDARLAVAEAQREVADTRARNAHLAKKLQAQGAAVGGAASFEGLGFGAGGLGLGFAAAPVMAEERLALAAPRLFALEPEGQFPAAHEDAQMEARLTALAQEEDRLRQDLVEFRRRIVGGLEEDPSEGMAVAAPRDSRAAAGRRAAGKADARRPHFYGSEGEGETESSSSSSSSAAEERRAKKKKRSKRGKKEEKSVPAAPAAVIDPAAASNSAMLALAQILQGLQGSMQPQRGPVNQETAAPIPASAPAAPVTLSPRARSPEAEAAPVPAVLSPRHSASPSPVPDLPPPRTSPPVASPSPTPTPSIENPTAASPPREPAAVLPGRAVGSLLGLDATPSLSSVAEGEVTLAGGSNASDSRSTAPEEPAPAPATAPVSSSTPQLSPRSLVEAAEAAGPSASLVFQQDISAVLGGGSRRQSFGDDTLDLPSMALTAADLASPARPRGILEDTPDHDHDDDIVDRTERSPASPRGGAGGESESDAVDLGIEGDLPLPASLPPSEAASDRDRRDAFAVDPYDDLSQFRQIDDLLGGSEGSGISVPGLKGDRSNGSLDVPKSEGSGSVF